MPPRPPHTHCVVLPPLFGAARQFFKTYTIARDQSYGGIKWVVGQSKIGKEVEGLLQFMLYKVCARGCMSRGRPLPPLRAPSLCPATVLLTPSASLNGICNRQ